MDTLARASPSTVISTTVMCVAWASSGTSSSPRHCPASTITASFTCEDAGAPGDLDEVEKLEEVLPIIWEELSPEARAVIEKQGVVYTDQEGDLVTSIVNNKDCVFTCYDEKGCCYCAIEKAYRDGKTDFYKPVSCHLYPIRIGDYGPYKAVNYHRWDVCKAAVLLGKKENVAVYQFLKEPLIRKFGEKWYQELEVAVKELKAHDMI